MSQSTYSNPSTTYGNTQMSQNTQQRAYDTTNQNSPYYYQRVPSTAQYNSVLGVNAGFPQLADGGVMRDSYSNQGTMNNQAYSNQQYNPSTGSYSNQAMYNPSSTGTTQGYSAYSNQQYDQGMMNNQGTYNNQYNPSSTGTTQGYNAYSNQGSTVAPQYSQDSISCCSQVSSTCCYQTQSGNSLQYSPSVYQYGRK